MDRSSNAKKSKRRQDCSSGGCRSTLLQHDGSAADKQYSQQVIADRFSASEARTVLRQQQSTCRKASTLHTKTSYAMPQARAQQVVVRSLIPLGCLYPHRRQGRGDGAICHGAAWAPTATSCLVMTRSAFIQSDLYVQLTSNAHQCDALLPVRSNAARVACHKSAKSRPHPVIRRHADSLAQHTNPASSSSLIATMQLCSLRSQQHPVATVTRAAMSVELNDA